MLNNITTKKVKNDIAPCDVLLTYEIKNREIENLCLIKYELERRGYSVQFRMQYESFFTYRPPIQAKVVVVPGYYRERHQFYASSHTVSTDRILNMQWEQVRSSRDEKSKDTLFAIKDWGRKASHIAWGSHMQNRLINEWKCDPSHVFMTGHLTFDFFRSPLTNYYLSRNELLAGYGIPAEKKVHLFISSLAYADVDMRKIRNSSMGDTVEEVLEYKKLCKGTRSELIRWFETALSIDEDSVIVYRPHPEEKGDEELFSLERRQSRFRVIKDRSVKQWILACDRVYTWKSTSVIEVIAAKKEFILLRPIPIPLKNDIELFQDVEHVTTFEEFSRVFSADEVTMNAKFISDQIDENYYFPEDKFSYELVCDAIEKIMQGEEYKIYPPLKNELLHWYDPERLKNLIKRFIRNSKLCESIHNNHRIRNNYIKEIIDDIFYVKEKIQKNYTSDEEVSEIVNRIKEAMTFQEN